jgi:aspartyl-tRNA(Asn)/glutamyl-tRNA(Gln) amidotransferase subunit A
MARSVRDLAILFQAIAGFDPTDPTTCNLPVPDLQAAIVAQVSSPRLGRVRGLFEDRAEPMVRALMDRVEELFRAHGAKVSSVALPAAFDEVLVRHHIVMGVEAAQYHEPRLLRHPEDYPPKIRSLLEEGLGCRATDYARTKEHQRQLAQEMPGCFEGVDALLTPATRGPAPDAASTGDPAFNSPWSYSGLPTISLPAGWTPEGLPLAIQLVGRAFDEAQLFAVAAWCEKVLAVEKRDPADNIQRSPTS